ncbi:MAG: hypothetical protein HGA27_03640 [Peptococcaceae bacterium]|nr:hypothetical protein [Peptococcaceae bacterium]
MEIIKNMKKTYYKNISKIGQASEELMTDFKKFFSKNQTPYRLQVRKYPLYRFEIRIKSWESIEEKIERKEQYKNATSLGDIPDIIGFLIIVELEEDVENVIALLEREKKELIRLTPIAYLEYLPTTHENGKMNHHYDGTYIWEGNKFNFEIQVRSEVENLWSNIEHMSFYKNKVKSRNDRILNRLKEHSYNLLHQADDVLSILRRERMKNDILDLKEKMMDALEVLFDGIKFRDVVAISGYMYDCWELPFEKMTVEDFENFFASSAKITDEKVLQILREYLPEENSQRLHKYLINNLTISDTVILKIGIANNEGSDAVEYLISDMEEVHCDSCGQWMNYDDADYFSGKVEPNDCFYCQDCAHKNLTYCEKCNTVLTNENTCILCSNKTAQ